MLSLRIAGLTTVEKYTIFMNKKLPASNEQKYSGNIAVCTEDSTLPIKIHTTIKF